METTSNLTWKKVIYIAFALIMFAAGWQSHNWFEAAPLRAANSALKEELSKIKILKPSEINNVFDLTAKGGVPAKQVNEIRTVIIQAERGKPDASFVWPAFNPELAAEDIRNQIAKKNSSLPPEAIKTTDQTLITVKDQNVNVYKIDNWRKWSVGTGVGTLNGQTYVPAVIEYRWNKKESIDIQGNFQTPDGASIRMTGGQIVYKRSF